MEEDYEVFDQGGTLFARFKSDGYEMPLADLLAFNNPGTQYDPATGLAVVSTPVAADPVGGTPPAAPKPEYQFGDVGRQTFSRAVEDVKSIAGGGGEITRSMLPEDWRQTFPDSLLAAGDYGLAGLTGLLGGIETAAGYAGDTVEGATGLLGIDSRYAPGGSARALQRDLMAMFDAAGALPEGRMLASIGEAARPALTAQAKGAAALGFRKLPGVR
jgi:hypothetical protein